MSSDALRSVSCLTSLRKLDLELPQLLPHQIRSLSSLSLLQSCFISTLKADNSVHLEDATSLFVLTQLTWLDLQDLHHNAAILDAPCLAQAQSSVALLGGLVNIRFLVLGIGFVVDDATLAALRHLTRLTGLECGRMQLTHQSSGHLSGLQSFHVDTLLSPCQWLQTLHPLSPLPSLRVGRGDGKHSFPHPIFIMPKYGHSGRP